jgi:signal transduction histidine kinase
MCDEDMTLQVLLNLLLNSLRATEEGDSVTVSLSSDGGLGVIKIEDNGKGISPALLPDVFKPYVSSSEDGHGLGLAIVKRVSQCHNWKVDISSKEGNGTTVSIRNIQIAGKIQPDRLREV